MKISNPNQWYSKVKLITKYKPHEQDLPICQEISNFDDQHQADLIADTFELVANQYDPLGDNNVTLPEILEGSHPKISVKLVFMQLSRIKTNKSTVYNDLPGKIIKTYPKYLCYPLCHILNTLILH